MKIEVEIIYTDEVPDESQRYLAQIKGGEYNGTIVTGFSVSDCFKELSISMFVLDDFKSKHTKVQASEPKAQ